MKAPPDMTVAETAEHLGISTQRVYNLIQRGILQLVSEDRPKLVSGASIARRSYRPPGFITVAEAAEILGVARSTAYHYVDTGVLVAVTPHDETSGRRHWLVNEGEVRAMAEGLTA